MHATISRPRAHPPWWVRGADAAAALLLGLALLALLTGGARFSVAGIPLSITRPAHLIAEASVILLLRTLVWRGAGAIRDLALVTVIGGFVVGLAADSRPQRVGDGGEYMAMAQKLGRLAQPTITPADVEFFSQARWGEIEGHRQEDEGLRGADQRQDFIHFWFYPLLAAPLVRAADMLGLHPNYGFTALNLLLLLGTAIVLLRRLDAAGVVLLMCSPILWWIDKAHTEVFTFTMLALGFALLRERPWWSMVAFGAASTQNPPIAVALGLTIAAMLFSGRIRDARVRAGAAAGIGLAIASPLYYYWRLGVWFPLRGAMVPHWPGAAAFTAVLWDPNLGILLFTPMLTLAAAVAIGVLAIRDPARLISAEVCGAALLGAWFLFSFSQAGNVNSGATFGPSRYGLWLLPLAVPLLHQVADSSGRDRARWLRGAAMVAIVWAAVICQPRFRENYLEPSRLARLLWTRWPSLDNPIPEIFTERLAQREVDLRLPIATTSCEKALLVTTEAGDVRWPPQCPSQPTSPACARPGSLCYANRTGTSYEFSTAPSQPSFVYRVADLSGR